MAQRAVRGVSRPRTRIDGRSPFPGDILFPPRLGIGQCNHLIKPAVSHGTETGTRLVLAHKTVRAPVSLPQAKFCLGERAPAPHESQLIRTGFTVRLNSTYNLKISLEKGLSAYYHPLFTIKR
jgi:hypothetical protein